MASDLLWLLWTLPLAFALGWWLSRFDVRQWRHTERLAPKAYFRGLNHLLNEQQDEAIDAFIEAVQHDADTLELHFALGNLFRKRGDYDRAIRVHQHLLARADLSPEQREQAQHGLASDFFKAGLFDRAEDALLALQNSRYAEQARRMLLTIYERSRDWNNALRLTREAATPRAAHHAVRAAQYCCELGDEARQHGKLEEAQRAYQEALTLYPQSVRPVLALAQMAQQQGDFETVGRRLLDLVQAQPKAAARAASAMVQWVQAAPEGQAAAVQALQAAQAHSPSLDVTLALAKLQASQSDAILEQALAQSPALAVARERLRSVPHTPPGVLAAIDRALDPALRYRCTRCGFEAQQYFWQCPGCQSWESFPFRRCGEG